MTDPINLSYQWGPLPVSLEQQTLNVLKEIRDLLEKQYNFHVNQLPVNERPKKK